MLTAIWIPLMKTYSISIFLIFYIIQQAAESDCYYLNLSIDNIFKLSLGSYSCRLQSNQRELWEGMKPSLNNFLSYVHNLKAVLPWGEIRQ